LIPSNFSTHPLVQIHDGNIEELEIDRKHIEIKIGNLAKIIEKYKQLQSEKKSIERKIAKQQKKRQQVIDDLTAYHAQQVRGEVIKW